MAQIKQIGVGRKSSGTIDGITYYVRNGKTFARSTPSVSASSYNTPDAKLRQAIFKMVQMHMKYHLRTIRHTFSPKNGSPSNHYHNKNGKALTKALSALAVQYVAGEDVTLDDIEQAIAAYAAENPKSIVIASKTGYGEVYLTGPWPETITLRASGGDSTIIVIVAENGTTTTINPNAEDSENTEEVNTGNGGSTDSGNTDNGGTTGGGSTEPGNGGGDNNGDGFGS